MENLLMKLMLIASLAHLGISLGNKDKGFAASVRHIEVASRAVLHIDWKPISVFPREGRRFR